MRLLRVVVVMSSINRRWRLFVPGTYEEKCSHIKELKQKEGINNLLSDDKIDSGLFIIIAIVIALSLLSGVYSGVLDAKGDWGYLGQLMSSLI